MAHEYQGKTLLILIYYPHLLLSADTLLERWSVFCRYPTHRPTKYYLEKKRDHSEDSYKKESYMSTLVQVHLAPTVRPRPMAMA